MTGSWCIERMGDWILRDVVQSYEFSQVVNATVMSALSIVLLFPLDCIADKLQAQKMACGVNVVENELEDELDDSLLDDGSRRTRSVKVASRSSIIVDPETHERAIRVIIGGLAFLVGNA